MKRYLFVMIIFSTFSCTEDIPIILPEQEEQLGAYVFINQTVDTASVIIERTLRFEETLVETNSSFQNAWKQYLPYKVSVETDILFSVIRIGKYAEILLIFIHYCPYYML